MKYFLDTEFNEQGGELISMALVAESGSELYFELPIAEDAWKPWVREHVKPHLTGPVIDKVSAQRAIELFFGNDPAPHVCCDWPADIAHLCTMLDIGEGNRIGASTWVFELRGQLDAKPETPHNALSDARAIRAAWPA